MSVIHLTQEVESETLHLPELRPLIGKKVEITIREVPTPAAVKAGWDALAALAGQDLLDDKVIEEYREFDKKHWRANLP
jgi:hypothetical protein